jgi:hypothetical protein
LRAVVPQQKLVIVPTMTTVETSSDRSTNSSSVPEPGIGVLQHPLVAVGRGDVGEDRHRLFHRNSA